MGSWTCGDGSEAMMCRLRQQARELFHLFRDVCSEIEDKNKDIELAKREE
jgi:hypothetical protein